MCTVWRTFRRRTPRPRSARPKTRTSGDLPFQSSSSSAFRWNGLLAADGGHVTGSHRIKPPEGPFERGDAVEPGIERDRRQGCVGGRHLANRSLQLDRGHPRRERNAGLLSEIDGEVLPLQAGYGRGPGERHRPDVVHVLETAAEPGQRLAPGERGPNAFPALWSRMADSHGRRLFRPDPDDRNGRRLKMTHISIEGPKGVSITDFLGFFRRPSCSAASGACRAAFDGRHDRAIAAAEIGPGAGEQVADAPRRGLRAADEQAVAGLPAVVTARDVGIGGAARRRGWSPATNRDPERGWRERRRGDRRQRRRRAPAVDCCQPNTTSNTSASRSVSSRPIQACVITPSGSTTSSVGVADTGSSLCST